MECFDDQTIARLMRPGIEPPAGFDRHIDECNACRQLVMHVARRTSSVAGEPAPPEPGQPVGRYLILDRLGQGGSGIVYRAYDPELQREVAVKLVAPSADPAHNARLLDEARTMARLTDPNVVRVYDAGTIGDSVFLAMELMGGGTLREWQRVRRPWDLVLGRYLEAGRGLAAAHERGLVHRDFKPSNVLLSDDGRACVGDFGLASTDWTTVPDATEDLGKRPRIAGTPLYMSPEAHRGDALDGRSDQYSFCIALFEALYGYVPYPGTSLKAVEEAKNAGRIAAGPRLGPRSLFRALAQGLRPDPAARFADMPALLDALRRGQHRRRSIASVAAVAAAALVGAMAYGFAVADREPECLDAASEIAETWNADVASRLEERASTLDLAAAQNIVTQAIARLDDYGQAWSETSVATCRAVHSGALTEDAHQRRVACLDESAAALGGLVHELETLDASMLPTLSVAAASLPDVEECDHPDAARPITAESVAALRRLHAARAAADVGRYQAARMEIERVLADAIAREDMWVAAEAGIQACNVALKNDPADAAIVVCEQAAAHAVRSGHVRAAAIAWSTVSGAEAQRLGHRELAARFDLLAGAAAEAAAEPAVFAVLAHGRAAALQGTDTRAAVEQARLAVAWEIEAKGPEHPVVARRRLTLVNLLGQLDRREEALTLLRETRASLRAAGGADDQSLAQAWLLEGALHSAANDLPEAIAAYERAVEGYTRVFGPGNVQTLDTRAHLAVTRAYQDPKALADAIAELDAVLPQLRALKSPGVWQQEATRAVLLQRVGRSDEAIAACLSALEAARQLSGADSSLMIIPHMRCGDIHSGRKERDEALAQWEAALSVAEKVNGPDNPLCIDIVRVIEGARREWNKPPRD